MHLSALCFTAIDNHNNHTKMDMVNYLLNYVPPDTILFQYGDEEDLHALQRNEWDPIIKWYNERYGTNLQTMNIIPPQISTEDKMKISKYLLSHTDEVVYGFVFAVATLKSIILSFTPIDQRIAVDKAVTLSRLEEEYQLKFWGRVEWAHDLNQQFRLAASVLFVLLNRSEYFVKEKTLT